MKVALDGIQLHVVSSGNGDAVVLLHGFPLSHAIWNPQVEALAKEAHVLALDLRGMGESDAPPGPYLMENLAGDIAALLDAMQIRRAAIVGHSMGGYAALAFFRMFSERVARLALISSRVDADNADAFKGRLQLADRIENQGMEPAVEAYLPRLLSAEASPDTQISVANIIRSQKPAAAAAMLRGAAMRASSDDILEDIDVPVLLACGSDDSISPPEVNRAVAARIQNSVFKVIQRSAHLPMLENADQFTEVLQGFLNRHGSIRT